VSDASSSEPRRPGSTDAPLERSTVMELVHSWWVLLTLVPLGFGGWAGFVYAGLRAHRPRWVIYGALYGAALLTVIVAPDEDGDPLKTLAGFLIIGAWLLSFVHALTIRSEFLEREAAFHDPRLKAGRARSVRREAAKELAERDPALARELGVGRPDQAHSYGGDLIDVNHGPAPVLVGLPGVDGALAARIVAVREELGGFSSAEDLGMAVDLPAGTVDALRPRAIFIPR